MVRLADYAIDPSQIIPQFQFHYGSIGGYDVLVGHDPHCVSIPLWFDWRIIRFDANRGQNSFNSTMVRLAVQYGFPI